MLHVMTTGRATSSVDTILIQFKFKTFDPTYEKALHQAAVGLQKLQKSLMSIGFKKEQLKTTKFDVKTKYELVKVKTGSDEQKRQFIGYEVIHEMNLKFPFDMTRLSEVVRVIVGSGVPVEFNINFLVDDQEALENAALRDACLKAKTQAKTLAESLEVTLKGIAEISTKEHYHMYQDRQYDLNYSMAAEQMMDIQPDDVSVEMAVTVKYHI